MTLTLVIGGTRSGKSAHAERLVHELAVGGAAVRYVATADASDQTMAERIARHRARRPPEWETVQAGDDLAAAVLPGGITLIDGLGGWIAGVLHRRSAGTDARANAAGALAEEAGALAEAALAEVAGALAKEAGAARVPGTHVVVVAEEAGQGLLPMDAVARGWLDALGVVIQRLSADADRVDYVVAGRAIPLHAGRRSDRSGASDAQSCLSQHRGLEHSDLRHHGDQDVRPQDADHAVNVLAGGPPDWLREAMAAALDDDARRYPDDGAAREATGARHRRPPEEVVVTNGAVEALWLLPTALRPRHAICVHPGFTEAEAALRAHRVRTTRVLRRPEQDFALDPAAIPETADLVIVGNPASPSGTLSPASAIEAIRRPGRVVVVDEAFMEMVPGEPGSLADARLEDVIVVRSLTKILSIPGVRAGYALAAPRLAEALEDVKPPWSANALALRALIAAAAHPHELTQRAQRAAAESADLQQRLEAIPGVRAWPSVTNYVLIEVADGPTVVGALRAEGIAVRMAASFPGLGSGHVRLTARDPQANARLSAALERALAERGRREDAWADARAERGHWQDRGPDARACEN